MKTVHTTQGQQVCSMCVYCGPGLSSRCHGSFKLLRGCQGVSSNTCLLLGLLLLLLLCVCPAHVSQEVDIEQELGLEVAHDDDDDDEVEEEKHEGVCVSCLQPRRTQPYSSDSSNSSMSYTDTFTYLLIH